ncbi:hypothetical protein CEXT_547991 [Caerostris extrusa]|uniref:Uncharacterized protein n=1 Tax=Caerostris extrusa TaxID=172846 RepID=A0AAV4NXL4_CAEEX|nr:hypothetical protein CEXT_547991 [Caerostris extrusa]
MRKKVFQPPLIINVCSHLPQNPPGVYRISDFFKPSSMDRHDIEKIIQFSKDRPSTSNHFAKARKRRRMRLIKTDRRQKGMAVVFLMIAANKTRSPQSGVVREKFCPGFRRDDGRVRGGFYIGSSSHFASNFVE